MLAAVFRVRVRCCWCHRRWWIDFPVKVERTKGWFHSRLSILLLQAWTFCEGKEGVQLPSSSFLSWTVVFFQSNGEKESDSWHEKGRKGKVYPLPDSNEWKLDGCMAGWLEENRMDGRMLLVVEWTQGSQKLFWTGLWSCDCICNNTMIGRTVRENNFNWVRRLSWRILSQIQSLFILPFLFFELFLS